MMNYERLTKSRIRLVFIENVAGQEQTEYEINGIKQSILYNRLAELEDMIESGELKVGKEDDAEQHIIPTETIKEQKTEKNEPKNTDESDPALVIKDYKFSEFFEMCKNRENCAGCELANAICPCAICGDKNKYMCEKCKMKEWAINPCIIPTVLRNANGKIILEKEESK